MDYVDYVRNISFRFLKPSRRRPKGFRAVAMLLRKFGLHLEVINTRLPCDHAEMKRRLQSLCKIPRMSTFALGAIINRGIAQMPDDQAFVNIGVWNGYTFFSGMSGNSEKRCIGVDNFSRNNSPREAFLNRWEAFRSPRHSFHEMDYREYFKSVHKEPIGFYLFDGPHSYQDQLDAMKMAEPFFAGDCVVMVDDTNWEQVRRANLDFINSSPNRYRILLDVQTPKGGHPTFWNGLMVFQVVGANARSSEAGATSESGKSAA